MPELNDPEDKKLITLARATRARTGATAGAAIRDQDGRTYAAVNVDLPSLQIGAVAAAVAMAVASGAKGLEAVVLFANPGPDGAADPGEVRVVTEFAGPGVPVHLVDAKGNLLATQDS